jgi:hypothetical protein
MGLIAIVGYYHSNFVTSDTGGIDDEKNYSS